MSFMLQFDLNIFAVVLLIALYFVVVFKQETLTTKRVLFRILILVTIMMLVLEVFSWMFDGGTTELDRTLNYVFNFFFTAFNTLVVSLWASYIDYTIYGSKERIQKRWYYLQPSILLIILSIINLFYPILWYIDDDNFYHRLPFIWISITMTMMFYVYAIYIVAKNRKNIHTRVLYGVLTFLGLPIFAALMQLWFYGLLLIWPATAVALIFSYLIFETTSSSRDFLTGAYTRYRAEEFIKILLKKKRRFSVIMIDLDDFKKMNDTFGHHIGDRMLVEMTSILQLVFKTDAVVSRYGGDEFVIVVGGDSETDIELYRDQIIEHLAHSDNFHTQQLKFSYGVVTCDVNDDWTMEALLTTADNNMYLDKANNKNYKRRKSDLT